jgi:hypothetical protein
MPDTLCAADLRRWAVQCAERALTLKCAEERQRLSRMREAILMLAENADWLAGAGANARTN